LLTTWSTDRGAVVIVGGRRLESVAAPEELTAMAVSIRKTLMLLCIELCIELKTALTQHQPQGIAYHYRRASLDVFWRSKGLTAGRLWCRKFGTVGN
jgi:hypothetical protein